MKGGTRRSHTKSRNGCSHCRKARVKCDGQAPHCARCASRKLMCDFEDDRTRSRTLQPSWTQHPMIMPSPLPLRLTIEQRSLLHHFVNSTCNSMITHNTSNSFWQMDVPCEALRCNYLLSAILALSTLHKTHLLYFSGNLPPHTNLNSNIDHSLRLHQAAVSQFTASVSSITRQNLVPAIALSSLSAVYSCGLAQLLPTLTPTDHVNQAVSVLISIYKALRLFRNHKPWMGSTNIEIEDHDGPDMTEKRGRRNGVEMMLKARKLRVINDLSCDNDNEKAIYDAAITAFLDIHAHWTLKIPPKYMDLLQQKRPMALLILDVFVLENIEDGGEKVPWFMSVWKEGLTGHVRDYLGLLWTEYHELEVGYEFPSHINHTTALTRARE